MNDYVDLAESNEIDEEDLSDVEKAQAMASRDPGKQSLVTIAFDTKRSRSSLH
jgi:hypothetical protein